MPLVLTSNLKSDTMCRFGIAERQSGVVEIGQGGYGSWTKVFSSFRARALSVSSSYGNKLTTSFTVRPDLGGSIQFETHPCRFLVLHQRPRPTRSTKPAAQDSTDGVNSGGIRTCGTSEEVTNGVPLKLTLPQTGITNTLQKHLRCD